MKKVRREALQYGKKQRRNEKEYVPTAYHILIKIQK